MIISYSEPIKPLMIPSIDNNISMLPFHLSNLDSIFHNHRKQETQIKRIVGRMIDHLPRKEGLAFLTVHGTFVKAGCIQRRGGAHIDGNYLTEPELFEEKQLSGWAPWRWTNKDDYIKQATMGWNEGGGFGWTLDEPNPDTGWSYWSNLLPGEKHNGFYHSYLKQSGGMLIASNVQGCKGWQGQYDGRVGAGGSTEHLPLKDEESFIMKANTLYYGNSHFIHESLPVKEDCHRTIFRITLPHDYPWLEFHNPGDQKPMLRAKQ